MPFPNFPNPTRRAKLLRAHQLRQQGLTLRQIGARMDCAHSTVSGYLNDFELFRVDLIHELSADQIVSHLIQLADIEDEHHDRRLAAVRELRLLLATLPEIRRDETDRTVELVKAGVTVDRYGARYAVADRFFAPSQEELDQAPPPEPYQPEPDQPLAYIPEPARTEPDHDEPNRTDPNKPEQEISKIPAHNGRSSEIDQNSPPLTEPPTPDPDEPSGRDWASDYPPHNPWHPRRLAALERLAQEDGHSIPNNTDH